MKFSIQIGVFTWMLCSKAQPHTLLLLWVCVMGKILMLIEEHLNHFCIREIDVPFVPPLTALTDEDDADN